jgi:TrmH family RNA methyltransferase
LGSDARAELSNNSALVLKARGLLQKKYRDSSGLFLIEGPSTIVEGLRHKYVKQIFYTSDFVDNRKIFESAKQGNVSLYLVSSKTIKSLSDTKTQPGVIAVAQNPVSDFKLESFADAKKIIYLDSVRDPGNAGTIIRAAAAFGMDGVIFSKDSVDPTNPKTVRATTGSIFQIPIYQSDALSEMKNLGFDIYLTDPQAELILDQVEKAGRQIWVFSNEAQGLNKPLEFTHKVKISIRPETESLNVAQAATVVMFYLTSKI